MQFLPLTLRLQVYNSALGVNSLPYHCTTKICQESNPRTYSQNSPMRAANPIQNDVRVKAFSISSLVSAKLGCISTVPVQPHSNPGCGSLRSYATCCPRPPKGCGCPAPGGGRKIVPPTTCRPGPIPPNPCVPVFHHGKDTWKRPKYIFFFLCLPVIIIQAFQAFSHEMKPKDECRDYEYMRIRSKRFPWGDGVKSLFHNDHVNHLPGECVPPPLDCD